MAERFYYNILEVNDLYTSFNIPAGEVRSVNGVSFALKKGRVLGIVGESGSGKSVTAYSIMQILQNPGRIVSGSIKFKGKELIGLPDNQLQKIRGEKIAIIFQDPMSSLNPVYTIGNQIREAIKLHPNRLLIAELDKKVEQAKQHLEDITKKYHKNKNEENAKALSNAKEAYKIAKNNRANYVENRALEMLRLVGINEPEKRLKQYPFEFSGGMLQRIMIAMSLVCEPDILIADEPTTALDVTIQAQILELLQSIQKKMGMAIIIITHDLGVVAQICDDVAVMYAGRIVERGTVNEIFYTPKHEYTKGLLNSIPKANDERDRLEPIEGNPVDVFCLGKGCSFAPRCKNCMKICLKKYPARVAITEHHSTCCFKYVIDAYKQGELNARQLDKILDYSNEGTASFTPVSRLDILDALSDYNIANGAYKNAKKNKETDKEKLEQLEFKVKETKANYIRSKNDFKMAEKNRKFNKRERPATERIDMIKKARAAKKEIRYLKNEDANRRYVHNYITNLEVTSFPVDLTVCYDDVASIKEKVNNAKTKLKKVHKRDKISKTEILCEIDNAKREYENVRMNYERALKVSYVLFLTRKSLVRLNIKRIKKAMNSTVKSTIKEFKQRKLALSKKELDKYLANFEFANWTFKDKLRHNSLSIIKHNIKKDYKVLKHLYNSVGEKGVKKKILEALSRVTDNLLDYGDYQLSSYFHKLKPYFFNKLKAINNKNSEKKTVVKGGNR